MICALPKNCQNKKSNGLAMADNSCLRRRRICTNLGGGGGGGTFWQNRMGSAPQDEETLEGDEKNRETALGHTLPNSTGKEYATEFKTHPKPH